MYIDPGTGSVLLQAVLAAALGVGVFVKVFWKKIKGVFGKKDAEQTDAEDSEEDQG
jgi:hypothetical protein